MVNVVGRCIEPAEQCHTTWDNYTGRNLIAGTGLTVGTDMTSKDCAEICAYNISDCVAVVYYHDGHCVVYRNPEDVSSDNISPPNNNADVYVMKRCNATGIHSGGSSN